MRVVIVGTGTNVGKTHLTVALLVALGRRGRLACGLKPVESGVPAGEAVGADAQALAAASTFHVKHPPPYALLDPVSPHLAARRAGVSVELDRIQRWVADHDAPWLLIETAGGLLSPLGPAMTNLDLGLALAPDVWILVAMDRLGVLHDVAACMRVLRTAAEKPIEPIIVLQAPEVADASTGTNADELLAVGVAEHVFRFPRGEAASTATQLAAAALLDRLGVA